jgi:hypothetical protein
MIMVEYQYGKLMRRALLFAVAGIFFMGTWVGVPVGLYLIACASRAAWKATMQGSEAIIQHARGLEIRTLWGTRTVSFDHYTGLSAETIFFHLAGLPIPGPVMLVIHSNRGGLFGKRKLRIPLGFLKLREAAVPMIAEAIELFAMPHREAGATWHAVMDQRAASEDRPPPPRALAPRQPSVRVTDPLEGRPRGQLLAPPAAGFGRKIR